MKDFFKKVAIYAFYSVAKMNIKSKEIWRVITSECGSNMFSDELVLGWIK